MAMVTRNPECREGRIPKIILNLNRLDVSQVENMDSMFYEPLSLREIIFWNWYYRAL